eukprot:4573943-Amphidinium_carterae.1
MHFVDFQGALLTPTIVHLLARLASPHITGCWGYDSLLYSAVEKWTGRAPRIGIADQLVVNMGLHNLSSLRADQDVNDHPCGNVTNLNGYIVHDAARDQVDYWHGKSGLQDNQGLQVLPSEYLQVPHPGATKALAECSDLLAPGSLAEKIG